MDGQSIPSAGHIWVTKMMKNLIRVMLLGSLYTVTTTHADTAKPTLENAHSFIKEMVDQGRLTGYDVWWYTNKISDFKSQNCETSYKIMQSGYMVGKESPQQIIVTIPWDKISDVSGGSLSSNQNRIGLDIGIWINGSLQVDGYLSSKNKQILKVTDSDITQQRLIKAMNFIRQQCDTTKSKYGF